MISWQRKKVLLFGGGKHIFMFVKAFIARCLHDRVSVTAGHLTYVTLLSLVPLMAVIVAVMASLPAFDDIRATMQELVVDNLIPSTGEAVEDYVSTFVANAHQLSAVGMIFLFGVAIMLMSNIDKALNRIWRVTKKRRFSVSLAVYWMILTLGPLLIGLSIVASSYVLALTAAADMYIHGINALMLTLLPLVSTSVAFLLVYVLVPNKVVKIRHAIWGALVAAALFEFAKHGFSMYLQYFPTYERLYGTVATIPILIVWIYLSWNIILVGAEVTATIEEYVGADAQLSKQEKEDPDMLPDEPVENSNSIHTEQSLNESTNPTRQSRES